MGDPSCVLDGFSGEIRGAEDRREGLDRRVQGLGERRDVEDPAFGLDPKIEVAAEDIVGGRRRRAAVDGERLEEGVPGTGRGSA